MKAIQSRRTRSVRAAAVVSIFALRASAQPAPATVAPPAHATDESARVMTLDECITTALNDNVEARSSALEVDAAKAARAGARGELLPRLKAEGALQQWNQAFELPFALPGLAGPPPVLTVRDAFTWTGSVSVIQPITGLIGGLERHKAESLGIDVAKLEYETTRRDTAFRVAEQYLRVLEAKRLVEVADASITALEAQRKQATSLHTNGVIAKNDLLRAELALTNAKQRGIQARGNVIVARGRLGVLLGLPSNRSVDVSPLGATASPSAEPTTPVASAEEQSTTHRIELRAFDARIEREGSKVRAARDKLIPQVSAVGNYTHFAGSAFQQKDAAYVGVVGSWDVWDWGATLSGAHEADARREQAKLARVKVEEQVRLEARQAAVDAQNARDALDLAKVSVEQAEENFRIVSKRFEQAAATAFDVVDAESLLTQSRAQIETATYGWLVARLALQRATGETSPRVQ